MRFGRLCPKPPAIGSAVCPNKPLNRSGDSGGLAIVESFVAARLAWSFAAPEIVCGGPLATCVGCSFPCRAASFRGLSWYENQKMCLRWTRKKWLEARVDVSVGDGRDTGLFTQVVLGSFVLGRDRGRGAKCAAAANKPVNRSGG